MRIFVLKNYIENYLAETQKIAAEIDHCVLEKAIDILRETRAGGGRLFILGVGGSAANASHAVNDFRKIARLETYTPIDNVSELTAWTNDNGFEFIFINWLRTSRLKGTDTVMVFSVGGGSETTSKNLVLAMQFARAAGSKIVSIVSRDGGAAAGLSDACILVPVVSADRITPHAEGWQGILWHLMVNALNQD